MASLGAVVCCFSAARLRHPQRRPMGRLDGLPAGSLVTGVTLIEGRRNRNLRLHSVPIVARFQGGAPVTHSNPSVGSPEAGPSPRTREAMDVRGNLPSKLVSIAYESPASGRLSLLYRHAEALTDPAKQPRQSLRPPRGKTVDRDPARAFFGCRSSPTARSNGACTLPWAQRTLLSPSMTACWMLSYSRVVLGSRPGPVGTEPPVEWRIPVLDRLGIIASLAMTTTWPILHRSFISEQTWPLMRARTKR